ncbi:hypothetical protein SB679_24840, partial [Chryseobacterium sp. SIMBA_029]
MKKTFFKMTVCAAGIMTAFTLSSCNDSDNNMMDTSAQRTITFENVVTPKDFVESGSFQGTGTAPVIKPGQSVSIKFS